MTTVMKIQTPRDVQSAMAAMRKRLKAHRHTYVLMQGPVGGGKIMIARRFAFLVPKPKGKDLEALSWLYLRLRWPSEQISRMGTFRAPHHTISQAGMLGSISKNTLYPGEVSLAHAGTLLLDDVQEFRVQTFKDTRYVLKHSEVILSSRAGENYERVIVPADPRLVIVTAPSCPCGHLPRNTCVCKEDTIARYNERLNTLLSSMPMDFVFAVDTTHEARERLGKYKRPGD